MQILNCVSELGTCCSDFGLAATLNIVRNILTIIQIVVPLILIVMSTVSLTKMVINPDEKKGMKKIYNQYLAAVFVFLVPMFVDMLLIMMPNSYSLSACWEQAKDNAELLRLDSAEYKEIDSGQELKKLTGDNYERGVPESIIGGDGLSTSAPGTASQQDLVNYARQFVGYPYKLGGHWNGNLPYTPTDCAGFVDGIYKHFGYNISVNPKLLKETDKYTVVTNEPHQPGDIVYYDGHFAMMTGNGTEIIHAASKKLGIIISKDYRKSSKALKAVVRVNAVANR